jgi:hypothetical protein
MTTTSLDLTADIIDVRDIIARIEELELEVEANGEGEHIAEWKALTAIMDDLKGSGGDEQWRGDWYPVTLIRDHYFTDYCRELVQDIGDLPKDIPAYIAIDWDATADNLRVDYSSVEIACNDRWVTYWYR